MAASDRELPDWLSEFMESANWGEAPPYFYFWTGVATIAAALQRKVYLDMGTFTWYPNLYTLLVAKPGIIQKSSTSDLGMRMLRALPGITQGPTTLTWQSLYDAFIEVGHEFTVSPTETRTQSALYINSPEFGITLNMQDTDMINQLIHIWDGYEMKKRTRKDGELLIPTPSLNLIACTTPHWIAENVPKYLVGGGFTSRMLFVFGDTKARYVAYPQRIIPKDYAARVARLTRDLERISRLVGGFHMTEDAYEWGEKWYEHFHKVEAPKLDSSLIGGYIARKQTLVHKVAMVLVASAGGELVITAAILQRAAALVTELESSMPQVFSHIGNSSIALAADQTISYLDKNGGTVPFTLLYRYMHKQFPDPKKFDDILEGLVDAGYITLSRADGTVTRTHT